MKKLLSLVLVVMSLLVLVGCNGEDATSETGTESTIRIIAGTVAAAEYLDMMEVEIVGVVSTERGLPERYKDVPQIGTAMSPDLELIVSLAPDLFISDISLKEDIEALLDGQNIETKFLSNRSYEDVISNFEELGTLFGKEDVAQGIVDDMRTTEQEIMESIKDKEAPRVLVIFGTPESFMLATQHSYAGGLVEKIGGINVTNILNQGGPAPYVPFSLETVAELNPDVILRLSHVAPEVTRAAFEREFSQGFWVNLDAVKEGRVYDLSNAYFGVTANVRAKYALQNMAELLYGN